MKFDYETDDIQQELDREWFEDNPGRRLRLRCATGTEREAGNVTLVAEIQKGLRLRMPLYAKPIIKPLASKDDWAERLAKANENEAVLRATLREMQLPEAFTATFGDL